MAGRSNWYSDHPPACTCHRCQQARGEHLLRGGMASSRPAAASEASAGRPGGGSGVPPGGGRGGNSGGGGAARGCISVLALVVLIGAAAIGAWWFMNFRETAAPPPEPAPPPAVPAAAPTLPPTDAPAPTFAPTDAPPTAAPLPTEPPTAIPQAAATPTPEPRLRSVPRPTDTPVPTPPPAPAVPPTPTRPPIPTPAPTMPPPTPTPVPPWREVEITGVSRTGISYTLYLAADEVYGIGGGGDAEITLTYPDGETEKVRGYFVETPEGGYFGRVIVDIDHIGTPTLPWVVENIKVEVYAPDEQAAAVIPTATPQPTPAPRPTATPRPTPTPRPTAAPRPTATPLPTPAPRQPSTPRPTAAPQPTPASGLAETLLQHREYMLGLINAERRRAGVREVALGSNAAAQLHAESMLDNCFAAHWGMDGLKPYMRYTLTGGYQSNAENVSGLDYCIKPSDNFRLNPSVKAEIDEAMQGLMGSPGHRDNILDPTHHQVNIGLAWDGFRRNATRFYNLIVVQHFEGDYIEYDQLPTLENGVLTLSGDTRNGARFAQKNDLGVSLFYDQPPHQLTGGQLSQTYCYDGGQSIAALRPPLLPNWHYPEDFFTLTDQRCPDPYDVSTDSPAPQSYYEAYAAYQQAVQASQLMPAEVLTLPWITAQEWTAQGESFAVAADLSEVLRSHGDGVYTIAVWGTIDGGAEVISQYSIFHGVIPPGGYSLADTN